MYRNLYRNVMALSQRAESHLGAPSSFTCQSRCARTNSHNTESNDHYEVLGVKPDATRGQIKSAYLELAQLYHPDRNDSPGAKKKFLAITNAYEVLSDYSERRQYDMKMKVRVRQPRESKPSSKIVRPHTPYTKIYSFDEWVKCHYSETFERTQQRKQKLEHSVRRREALEKTKQRDKQNLERTLYILPIVFVGILVAMYYNKTKLMNELAEDSRKVLAKAV